MLFALLLTAAIPTLARAQDDIRVTASTRQSRIYMGDELLVEVLVEGASSPRQPATPSVDGAAIRFLGGSNISRSFTVTIGGKRTSNSTKGFTFQYALTPTRPGRIVVPPFVVELNGKTYRTEPIEVEAVEPPTDTEFSLELAIDESRVYLGQPVRARVTWFIAAGVNEFSFRASPVPPGFDVYLPQTNQTNARTIDFELFAQRVSAVQTRARRGNVDYAVLTFDFTLIPQEVGRQTVGPLNVVFSRRNGMRVERRQSISNTVVLDVLPLPTSGRPADFSGLVGVYTIDAHASPTSIAVGDPIELSVTISGPEPLTRLDAPDLSLDAGFSESFKASPDGWRRQPITSRGYRRFTTTVRARSDSVTEIPPIRLPYFDARGGEYRDALSEAIPLKVRAVREVTLADAITGPGRRAPSLGSPLERATDGIWALETDPDRLLRVDGFDLREVVSMPLTIGALGAPPALYAGVVVAGFVRRKRDPAAARRRRALAHARRVYTKRGAGESVRTFTGDLLNRPVASITGQDCLELAPEGSGDARLLAQTLASAEAGRFGSGAGAHEADRGELFGAMRRIEHSARQGGAR